jgi:2-desacetyl-2-hydroxyethyl bacteriochlorophyllide A dehydrogenase
MSAAARAFWTTAAGRGELREESVAEPGPDEVLVRTRFSGISRGTESLVFHGRVPPSEYERMRAPFMAGEFPFPVKYGYQNIGVVERGPAPLVGKDVFCLYPHQTRFVAPADAVTPIPATIPSRRGVLAANMETAVNALWDARLSPGDRVAVIGAGVVGCLVAHLARQTAGVDVVLVDIDPNKRTVAETMGARFVVPENVDVGFDRVFHTSGNPDGLKLGLEIAGTEATIVELSWYGIRPVELPLGGPFHARRLRIVSSQVGTIPAHQRSRWTYARRRSLAVELLEPDELDALLTSSSPFEDLPASMARVAAEPGELCHVVEYPEA